MSLKDWRNQYEHHFTPRDWHFLMKHWPVTACTPPDQISCATLEDARTRYGLGEPMAYIIGKEEFYGKEFLVNKHTLIPRPETELIVERAITLINQKSAARILDLGCGSGNIAITLKAHTNHAVTVIAADISSEALIVTRRNAVSHQNTLGLLQTDLFACFKEGVFDMIVTNPPYVEEEYLAREQSLSFEPRAALWGGADGLFFIRPIITEGHRYLVPGGHLVIEVGAQQKDAIDKLLDTIKVYRSREWIIDYHNQYRGVLLQR